MDLLAMESLVMSDSEDDSLLLERYASEHMNRFENQSSGSPGLQKVMSMSTCTSKTCSRNSTISEVCSTSANLEEYFKTVPSDWLVSGVNISKMVGKGSFGTVHMGRWRTTTVAVKRLIAPVFGPKDAGQYELMALQKEVSIMSSLVHPHVVQFLGVTVDPPAVVMEYCEKGSLRTVLQNAAEDPSFMKSLPWKRRVQMALDAAKGMQFLHSRKVPIIHRDLKSPNLLVDKDWKVKVSDFGMSKITDLQAQQSSIACFNPRWQAPEVFTLNGRATRASDVYSFGIVMWEILAMQQPFKGRQPQSIVFEVSKGKRPEIPAVGELPGTDEYKHLKPYLDLMEQCWAQDAQDRPSFDTIVERLGSLVKAMAGSPLLPRRMSFKIVARTVDEPTETPAGIARDGTAGATRQAEKADNMAKPGAPVLLEAVPSIGDVNGEADQRPQRLVRWFKRRMTQMTSSFKFTQKSPL